MFWMLALVGCGGETVVLAEAFDQTCDFDEDCVGVIEGADCGYSCGAPAAIAASDEPDYEETRTQRRGNCRSVAFLGCPNPTIVAACDQGLCVVESVTPEF